MSKIIIKQPAGLKKVLVRTGSPGVSVTNAEIQNNKLVFSLSNGDFIDVGTFITIPEMPDKDGKDYMLYAKSDRSGLEWKQV